MPFKPPKVSKSGAYTVEQEIDLKELFGVDMKDYPEIKALVGEAIIETIRNRTESGRGIRFNGDRSSTYGFKGYSDEYKASPEFRAFNKTSKVDLTMTGDMLGMLDIIDDSGNKITVGWEDSEQNAKAYNHQEGDTVPPRPFFGVSKSELKDISSKYKSEIKDALDAVDSGASKKEVIAKLGSLLDFIDGES